MEIFNSDSDAPYRAWIAAHPQGWVVNTRKPADPGYLVLHRARCPHISRDTASDGQWTTQAYQKICAATLDDLRSFARAVGRADGSFSKECAHCMA